MATYLRGSRDYIPQIQPFQPDLNFYKAVLDTKESQYQAGYDKLSKLYDTLLNSDMTRDINIERRNKFFQQIGNDIKKISSLDLSLEQNVEAAYNVFKPFINDKNIIKDMAWTKMYGNALGRAEYLKNCLKEECKDMYWSDGVKALNYMREDFSKATDDEALSFQTPTYTPYVNVVKEATKLAKDMGVSVKSFDSDGKFIITTTNGEQIIPTLSSYFTSVFGNDPRVQDVYNVKGYLQRKDYVYSNAETIGIEAAERQYLNDVLTASKKEQEDILKESTDNLNKVNNKKAAAIQSIQDNGVSMDDPSIAEMIGNLDQQVEISNANIQYAETNLQNLNDDAIADDDLSSLRYRADRAMGNALLINDLYSAAAQYAMLTKEEDPQVDPYGLANYEHGLALERMAKESEYNMLEKRYGTIMDIVKEQAKGTGTTKDQLLKNMNGETWIPNNGEGFLNANPNIDLLAQFNKEQKQYLDGAYSSGAAFLEEVYNDLNNIAQSKKGTPLGNEAINQLNTIFGKGVLDLFREKNYIDAQGDLTASGRKVLLDHIPNMNNTVQRAYNAINDKTNKNILFNDPAKFAKYAGMNELKLQYDQFRAFNNDVTAANGENLKNSVNYIINQNLQDDYKGGIPSTVAAVMGGVKSLFSDKTSDELSDEYRESFGMQKDNKVFLRNAYRDMLDQTNSLRTKSGFVDQTLNNRLANQKVQYRTYAERTADDKGYTPVVEVYNPVDGRTYKIQNNAVASGIMNGSIKNYSQLFGADKNVRKTFSDQMGKFYDDAHAAIKEVYNSGNPAVGVKDIRSELSFQSEFVQPLSTVVDPANFTTKGWSSFRSITQNYLNVKGQEGVGVFAGPPSKIGSVNLNAAGIDEAAEMFMLDFLYTDWKTDNKYRPKVQLTGSGYAYGNPDLTAYTFKIMNTDDYVKGNLAKKDAEGNEGTTAYNILKENNGLFTVVIPTALANNEFIADISKSPYEKMYDLKGEVVINNPQAGNVKIKNVGNGAKVTGEFYYDDPITGEQLKLPLDNNGPIFINGSPDIDGLVNSTKEEFAKVLYQNTEAQLIMRQAQNITKNANQYLNNYK